MANQALRILLVLVVFAFGALNSEQGFIFAQTDSPSGNAEVKRVFETFQPRGVMSDGSAPTPPDQALATFRLADEAAIELVAAEPQISQPLHLSWDSKGRMWVVEYRQYQFPAGLKIVEYDHHLRAVFDRTPEAPPNHTPGKDRITVFEDTTGDGVYDTNRTVIDGLNIATSVCVGDGGIWVLNPPYLLRYPDENGDAQVDGPPEVKLSGFGLQDTHAVANNLMWGPDGWIYGANGSTTTGEVFSRVTDAIRFEGQCIWRFHPKTDEFEIYAEGGGNTFSLDIDSKGRVFSGTNGGNTRGWYYPQGSYSRKNWGKHGPLTNPHAYGFFEAMRFEGDGRRFPQAFAIYEGGLFPTETFDRTIIAPNAMQNLVWHSELLPDGSTFRTIDKTNLLECTDRWFRPVYCGIGPDGSIYIADWYDTRLSHVSPTDDWHKSSGRIYRLVPRSSNEAAYKHGDLSGKSPNQLIDLLTESPNKWVRQRAALELGWKENLDHALLSRLEHLASKKSCLEALWALSIQGDLPPKKINRLLDSDSPHIRRWAVRLAGDQRTATQSIIDLARREQDVEVRSQLAATARRLDARNGLAIVAQLLASADDLSDPHIPLMCWWAVEAHADAFAPVVDFCSNASKTETAVFKNVIAKRLAQRFASGRTPEDFQRCERLLSTTDNLKIREQYLLGVYEAIDGRLDKVDLPENLNEQLSRYQDSLPGSAITRRIAQGEAKAIDEGMTILQDSRSNTALRMEIARALGQTNSASAEKALLKLATTGATPPGLQRTCIHALANFSSDAIAERMVSSMDSQIAEQYAVRDACFRVLASRESWARILLAQVSSWRVKAKDVPPDVVQRLRSFRSDETSQLVNQIFGVPQAVSTDAQAERIRELKQFLRSANQEVDLAEGQRLFTANCGICHKLFGKGQGIGPPLDNYDRGNLDFWLPAIVAPSIEIREGYQTYAALLDSGRVVSGMIVAQTLESVTIRTAAADEASKEVKLQRSEIEDLHAIKSSLMPENMLEQLSAAEIRDLFGYLMSDLGPTKSP